MQHCNEKHSVIEALKTCYTVRLCPHTPGVTGSGSALKSVIAKVKTHRIRKLLLYFTPFNERFYLRKLTSEKLVVLPLRTRQAHWQWWDDFVPGDQTSGAWLQRSNR
jgi:hypothetical protein